MSNHGNVLVRRATMADLEMISAFNYALAKETEARILDGVLLRAGVESLLGDPQKGWYAVAVSQQGSYEQKIIGQILITFEWSDWRNGQFWWLQSLYVDQQFRQQGVFRQLFEYVHQQAQKNPENICGFRLYVERENFQAHQAYAHMGFQETVYQMHEIEFSENQQTSSPSTS